MGDKAAARAAASAADVPVVPGSDVLSDTELALEVADDIGYPVLIKASAGGGGRGIRLVEAREDLVQAISAVQSEAQSSFGDGSVYLEKVITDSRHVEVQVVADQHGNVAHTFERDCSVQRRRQKLLEEAPAPELHTVREPPDTLSSAMLEGRLELGDLELAAVDRREAVSHAVGRPRPGCHSRRRRERQGPSREECRCWRSSRTTGALEPGRAPSGSSGRSRATTTPGAIR